jgi:hypothetical protein
MNKVTEARLRLIEARARALGLGFGKSGVTINGITRYFIAKTEAMYEFIFPATPAGLRAAESLLSLYEPGAMVRIEPYISKAHDNRAKVTWHVGNVKSTMTGGLAECYPGEGTYKLVRCDDV